MPSRNSNKFNHDPRYKAYLKEIWMVENYTSAVVRQNAKCSKVIEEVLGSQEVIHENQNSELRQDEWASFEEQIFINSGPNIIDLLRAAEKASDTTIVDKIREWNLSPQEFEELALKYNLNANLGYQVYLPPCNNDDASDWSYGSQSIHDDMMSPNPTWTL